MALTPREIEHCVDDLALAKKLLASSRKESRQPSLAAMVLLGSVLERLWDGVPPAQLALPPAKETS